MARGAAALLALQLLRGAQSQACINAAGDDACATYVGGNCHAVLAGTLTVGDVCEKACGRCGTLLEAGSEATCWGTTTFADCCTVAAARPASDGSCTTAECAACWGSPYPAGLFETCCLDQDPCRDMNCGNGRCVASGWEAACHCDPGWKGADGKEGREAGAVAPFCNTWDGFKTDTAVARLDSSDDNYYTRDQFLAAYNGETEWDAAAGLEQTCWDTTYTHSGCCSPADGTGDATCWDGDDLAGDDSSTCADDAGFTDGSGNACTYYQTWGCDSPEGGTTADALKAACPLSCGICSGKYRQTGGNTAGCVWDTTYTYASCCATACRVHK